MEGKNDGGRRTKPKGRRSRNNSSKATPSRNNNAWKGSYDSAEWLGTITWESNGSTKGKLGLKQIMQSVWAQEGSQSREVPREFSLTSDQLKGIQGFGRPEKRSLLRELADATKHKRERIKIVEVEGISLPKEIKQEKELSLAAVLIIVVALRARKKIRGFDPVRLFAELIGCSPPRVMEELTGYLRPPLITLKELPKLIHCAVRQIARGREDRSPEPVGLAIQTVNTIAAALEQLKEQKDKEKKEEDKVDEELKTYWSRKLADIRARSHDNKEGKKERKKQEETLASNEKIMRSEEKRREQERKRKRLKELTTLLTEILQEAKGVLSSSNDPEDGEETQLTDEQKRQKEQKKNEDVKRRFSRDLGCHAALLLAGVQRYIYKAQTKANDKKELCDLFIDASAALLSGIPVGGFVFGALGSATKYASHRWLFDKEEAKLRQLSQGVQQHFNEFIAGPVFFDGEYVVKGREEDEDDEVVGVDWGEFSKWYEQVISWGAMQNELELGLGKGEEEAGQ